MALKMEDTAMSNNSTTLSTRDQIFASLEVAGKIVATVKKSNFSTINEVVKLTCAMAGEFMGLARLNIRNMSQGWTMTLSLATRQTSKPLTTASAPISSYKQASLFS